MHNALCVVDSVLCVDYVVCKGELMKQEDVRQEDAIDLGRLLSIVVAKKKVVVCIVAVCTAIAAIVAFILPKEYTSQATVQVVNCDMGTTAAVSNTIVIDIANDMELLRSEGILRPVIEQVFSDVQPENRPDSESFAKKQLDINNIRSTQIIKISAKGRTPQEAQYIAENVAANFVAMKSKANEEKKAVVASVFDESIRNAVKEANDAVAAFDKYIAEQGSNVSTLEYQRLAREVEAKKAAYEALVVQAEQAKIQQSGKFARIVDEANLPDENNPSGPKRKLITVLGFVIGCVIALGYGVLLYRKDT